MIAGLSKAVTFCLAPLFALTAILLSLFTLLAPTLLLHKRVALLTVVPLDLNSPLISEMHSQVSSGKHWHCPAGSLSDHFGIVAWVAYAFYAVPIIASLAKLYGNRDCNISRENQLERGSSKGSDKHDLDSDSDSDSFTGK